MPSRHVPLQQRLKGKRVCVCVGAGGVGKTTLSAALALGLAARGQKVAVVSIDPARRLASALGLRELSNEPHRIDPRALTDPALRAVCPCPRSVRRARPADPDGAPSAKRAQSFTGELVGASDSEITLAADGGVIAIPYSEIRRSNLVEE